MIQGFQRILCKLKLRAAAPQMKLGKTSGSLKIPPIRFFCHPKEIWPNDHILTAPRFSLKIRGFFHFSQLKNHHLIWGPKELLSLRVELRPEELREYQSGTRRVQRW